MSDDTLLGAYLGEYQLESLLGQGGMARVYRGIDAQTGRVAAVKVIETSFQNDADYRARFEREAQVISRLQHTGIVRLYRYGEIHNLIYIAMQYVEGADLASVLNACQSEGNWLSLADTCHLAHQVAAALDYAHERKVIHRDVKPSNVLVGREGQAVLTDFGLALLTELGTRGEAFGTPDYISPEQAISSASAVPQSDQYSLAIMLYQILTGFLPFNTGNAIDTAVLHMTQPPEPPSRLRPALPKEVDAVLLKALEKKPEDRYATCVEMVRAFEKACQKSPLYTQGDRSLLVESVEKAMPVLPTLPSRLLDEKISRAPTLASRKALRARWQFWALFAAVAAILAVAAWLLFLS